MTTLAAGSSYSFTMDPHAKLTLVVTGKATLSFVSSANNLRSNFTVTDAQSKTYGPYGAIGTMTVTAVDRPVEYTVTPGVPMLSSDGLSLVSGDEIIALSEVTDYVNLTATGTAFAGACEYAGYVCTVAAGNITVYDNTSAAGTVIVPTTALVVGAYPIFGAGTNGKMALTTGCHVVLSGAATVNVLVG